MFNRSITPIGHSLTSWLILRIRKWWREYNRDPYLITTMVIRNDYVGVIRCIDRGVDINYPDDDGITAIVHAAIRGYDRIFYVLIHNEYVKYDIKKLLDLAIHGRHRTIFQMCVQKMKQGHVGMNLVDYVMRVNLINTLHIYQVTKWYTFTDEEKFHILLNIKLDYYSWSELYDIFNYQVNTVINDCTLLGAYVRKYASNGCVSYPGNIRILLHKPGFDYNLQLCDGMNLSDYMVDNWSTCYNIADHMDKIFSFGDKPESFMKVYTRTSHIPVYRYVEKYCMTSHVEGWNNITYGRC